MISVGNLGFHSHSASSCYNILFAVAFPAFPSVAIAEQTRFASALRTILVFFVLTVVFFVRPAVSYNGNSLSFAVEIQVAFAAVVVVNYAFRQPARLTCATVAPYDFYGKERFFVFVDIHLGRQTDINVFRNGYT